tara:strand:+ start:28809 stop:29324 length:516 start_codon:yes stop_codon:yes gene_type:complete
MYSIDHLKANKGFTLVQLVILVSLMGIIMALQARLTIENYADAKTYVSKAAIEELKSAYSDYYAGQCGSFINAPSLATLKSSGYLSATFNEDISNAGPFYLGATKSIDNIQILSLRIKFDSPAIAKSVWNQLSGEGEILSDKQTYSLPFFPYTSGERGASYSWFSSPNCPR